jgi:glucose/arabinose dehydrogenase
MRARAIPLLLAVLVATSLSLVAGPALPAAAAVPAGFSDQLVTNLSAPTAIAFTPDRRMLVTTQSGTVRIVQSGTLLAAPALDLTAQLCANSERGLLGIAVDPQFATNGFVFLYYSFRKTAMCDTSTVNRVSRFVMTGNTLGGEIVLIDNIPSPAGNHNAGDLQFGKDGMLYVSVGDGGCDYPGGTPSGCQGSNDAARDPHALVGKILRVDRNGNIPADNPYQGAGTARCNVSGVVAVGLVCRETFASGLRNPYRIAVDPNSATTRLYINDVGLSSWEEIDDGIAGADYGWNVREGHCAIGSTTNCGPPPAGMTNPIFDYGRTDGCRTITGGAFVPNGVWPAAFDGKYLFADFACGKIFRLDPSGGGFTRTDFATGLGSNSVVHLAFGPWRTTQALYYLTYAGGGQIRRIVHPAGSTAGDYDGDGDAERGVFRPANGAWYTEGAASPTFLGASGDVPVPADYDGDGDTDRAVYRPGTGAWYVQGAPSPVFWGLAGDRPVPADYDGDGDAEIAVWRPATGTWLVQGGGATSWGLDGDVPVPGDYDGDGDADLAVFRPATGAWHVNGAASGPVFLGLSGDVPAPADYDGDGDGDIAVFRPATGAWYVAGAALPSFLGLSGDVAVPADYDGDADADIAVFRPSTGGWYVLGVASPTFLGLNGDVPLRA